MSRLKGRRRPTEATDSQNGCIYICVFEWGGGDTRPLGVDLFILLPHQSKWKVSGLPSCKAYRRTSATLRAELEGGAPARRIYWSGQFMVLPCAFRVSGVGVSSPLPRMEHVEILTKRQVQSPRDEPAGRARALFQWFGGSSFGPLAARVDQDLGRTAAISHWISQFDHKCPGQTSHAPKRSRTAQVQNKVVL